MPDTAADAFDLVVIGAGIAGLTAALVGSLEGARVLLVERTQQIGGTSARSSGTVWIPTDTAAARIYLDALVGTQADREMREAFLEAGPKLLALLQARAGVRFKPFAHHPDYRHDLPGAALGGRPLEPPAFDGRLLGANFDRVAWPIRELMLFGGMMITRGEAARLLRAWKSPADALFGFGLVRRYLADRVHHKRGTRLVLGNALVARLYLGLLEREVPVWFGARVAELLQDDDGAVCGARIERDGATVAVHAHRGVILAGGGFPASAAMRERHLPTPVARHTPAAASCIGETIALGQSVGGVLGPSTGDNAFWFPSSVATRADGSTAVYPHIVLDRAKPGLVAVGASGKRFTNEAASYHEFTRGMYRSGNVPAWLVCDRRFLWAYGLGMIRPLTVRLGPYLDSGYLRRASTVEGLARDIGVDAPGLAETVRRHNNCARSGVDPEFGKGGNPYDIANGDPSHGPNPCLGPIARAPFFAVRVEPTPLGTALGLLTDTNAQVRGADGAPIPGLYAAGNDMHSPMGGEYPGAGAQLGPGMTFAYLAVLHALRDLGADAVGCATSATASLEFALQRRAE